MSASGDLPISEHFTLHRLAEGVYAAVATASGAAYSDAGLIDLGDRTLVFDAFENPKAAADLRQAATTLTGRPPDTVILSHWHPDHWFGDQVFADCAILATHTAREQAIPVLADVREMRENSSDYVAELRADEERLQTETDERERWSLQMSVTRRRHTVDVLPTLAPLVPNHTFDGKVVFHGSARTAELLAVGKGHTDSDCLLVLPAERVAFIGDLGFFQCQPFMPFGHPAAWTARLEAMTGWDVEVFVPGHGPLGTKADLALQVQYIRMLEEMVAAAVRDGRPVEDVLGRTLPAPFDAWQRLGIRRFEANVRSAYERQSR